MKDWYGTSSFRRDYAGIPATVIYLCEGSKASGGEIKGQLIYLAFESETDVQREFERQKQLLEQRLGPPCWDPARLNQRQQAFLSSTGQKLELRPGAPITWRLESGVFTDLSWGKWHTGETWNVVISTGPPPDLSYAGELLRTLHELSDCVRPDITSTTPNVR
jgi:hypothetical protein